MPDSAIMHHSTVEQQDAPGRLTRLLVSWQHPTTRTYHAVAMLYKARKQYEFAYLRRAQHLTGFRPFPGFSKLTRRYRSPRLFPLFSERVMDPSRPDRPRWLSALALDEEAPPMEILARSGGHRQGDSIEVLPEPSVSPSGRTSCDFMVHGVGHQAGAGDRISALKVGDPLRLVKDLGNEVNPRALLVTASSAEPLGWIPDPLLDYVHDVRNTATSSVRVLRANGPEVGNHLRLLVRLEGIVESGYRPFSGRDWDTLA